MMVFQTLEVHPRPHAREYIHSTPWPFSLKYGFIRVFIIYISYTPRGLSQSLLCVNAIDHARPWSTDLYYGFLVNIMNLPIDVTVAKDVVEKLSG